MKDRELLELAAKAAGITLDWDVPGFNKPYYINERGGHSTFNPLGDDGDALRLAVKTELALSIEGRATLVHNGLKVFEEQAQTFGNDQNVATRRVIVRAAAGLGEKMK